MKNIILVFSLFLILSGCSKKGSKVPSASDVDAVRANLAFSCTHESNHLPNFDSHANVLFLHARFLERLEGPKEYKEIAREYRIAAAYGHYKANRNLQVLIVNGLIDSPDPEKESIGLTERLIRDGVPFGYYLMGHYLESGYGVRQDKINSLNYFRKAADLGNPEAQAYIGDLLYPVDKAPTVARQMFKCAAEQGNIHATSSLAIDFEIEKNLAAAALASQSGVALGDPTSALVMNSAFKATSASQEEYLGFKPDSERAKRYEKIRKFLTDNEVRNPKVPDIDKIVPLPPAKLPAWDGTFEWQKEQEAAVPPKTPSEQLIEDMAKAKNLDPATGLPLSDANKTSEDNVRHATLAARTSLGTLAKTRAVCPEDGVWCAKLAPGQIADNTRRFLRG